MSIKQGGKESVKSGSNKLTHYFLSSLRATNIRYITNTILVIYFFITKKADLPKPLFSIDLHSIALPTSICLSVQLNFTSNSCFLGTTLFCSLLHRIMELQWHKVSPERSWKHILIEKTQVFHGPAAFPYMTVQ